MHLRNTGPTRRSIIVGKRWSDKVIFAQKMIGLAAEHSETNTVMIDATYLKPRHFSRAFQKAGHAAYINADQLEGNVDPGAEAAARLFEYLAS